MLNLDGVTYRHAGATADSLRDVTLALPPGSFTSLLGASGSGVSTLCLVLGGLAPRVVGGRLSGTLRVDGRDTSGWPMHRLVEHVVVGLGQPAAQLSLVARSVFEEVAFGPANLGLPVDDVLARTRTALERLGVAHLAERDPGTLSSGEQQRVVLAGLAAMGTRHLVLDGVLSHLDPAARAQTVGLLRGLADDGVGVLLAGHRGADLAFGTAWQQRLEIQAGRLSAVGDAGESAEGPAGEGPAGEAAGPMGAMPPAAGNVPDIRLEWVSHCYASGMLALDAVDLVIPPGQGVAIVGANGSGKTTLLRHLDGLLRPTRGRVLVGGIDTAAVRVAQLARSVAVGFGDPDDQVFARSMRAEAAFGPRQLGRDEASVARSVEAALDAVGLGALADAHPADLGASQRRLLALASLLAMESPVLVLDEPTAGLDDAGVLVVEAVVAAQLASGRSVIVASHDHAFVARAVTRVVRMDSGRIVADGPAAAVIDAVP